MNKNAHAFFNDYVLDLRNALDTIDRRQIEKATDMLVEASRLKHPVLVFGNGGSASLSEHFSCDHTKGVRHNTNLLPNVMSLASNMSLVTALANDYSYDEIFEKQIEYFQSEHCVAVGISASGNSPNVLYGLRKAREKNYSTIAFVGFDGGSVVDYERADVIIHVKSKNYGIVEDCHQILMHSISQQIRSSYNNKRKELIL